MEKFEIEQIARIAAAEAVSCHEKVIQEELDSRYHDVKLLMNNYRKLKAHYLNIDAEELEVSSLCSLKHKTRLMMSHVDRMLNVYKTLCETSGLPENMRKWRALYMRYIGEKHLRIDDIAYELGIDRRTFFRDIDKACADMAVLLFGLEAVGTWNPRKNKKGRS